MSAEEEPDPLLPKEAREARVEPAVEGSFCPSVLMWFCFFCVQLPCIVFALSYGVAGIWCFYTKSLVFHKGETEQTVTDKAGAACNEFQMLLMTAAGFSLMLSLMSTTVFSKALDDQQIKEFVNKTFPEQDWDNKSEGKPPGPKWYLKMVKDLDPDYKVEGFCNPLRCFIDFMWDRTLNMPYWVQCILLTIFCYIPCLFMFLHPFWWWKRITDFAEYDFASGDFPASEGDYGWRMNKASGLLTVVFALAAIWQHAFFMFDDIYVSKFAALKVMKELEEAAEKLETLPVGSDKLMNWNIQLGVVVGMKRNLEHFWSSPAVCLPWLTLGLAGVVLVLLGGITCLNKGFVSMDAVGVMSRNLLVGGCCIILFVLFSLSTIAALFCRHSTKTNSVASLAEKFLGLYLNKLAKETVQAEEGSDSQTTVRRRAHPDLHTHEYIRSIRRFVEYVSNDRIGARVAGGVLITRELAMTTLKTMVIGIGTLVTVNKGVLSYMQETLDTKSDGTAASVCSVEEPLERWLGRTPEERKKCCEENKKLVCDDPPQDREWLHQDLKSLQDVLDHAGKIDDVWPAGEHEVPKHLRSKVNEWLKAAKEVKSMLQQQEAKAKDGGEKAAEANENRLLGSVHT